MGTKLSPIWAKNVPKFCVLCIVILCIGTIEIDASNCKEGCPETNKPGNLAFVTGNVYTYDINSDINIFLSGNDAQETTIKLQGQAQLYAESKCKYALRLNKMLVFGPDHKRNQLPNDMQLSKIVRFTMANDEVEPEVCADSSDTIYSLNIKRSIISMIQSANSKRIETDVFGVCPTTFSSTKSGDQLIVTKVRNLNNCNYRETFGTGLITGIFDENSEIKTNPVLNGDYQNEQRIKNGILINAQANEEYQFLPFSSGDSGARAKVVTKLHLKATQQDKAAAQQGPHSRSILFENPNPQALVNVNNVKNALKAAVTNYQANVGTKAASQFVELIRLMRFTKKDDLLALYQQIKAGTVHEQKEMARKIYFDALFRTGTGQSVQVIANLLRNELNSKEQHLAYLSLNLVKSIDEVAISSINKLLDGNPPLEAYLSVGNLVSKFCRDHGCESNEIKSITEKFVDKLSDCRADTRAKENTIIAILKGLRNTNNLISPALEKVVQCTNEKHPTRIRVAALQAFGAGACNRKVQSAALAILKNRKEDSEVRIEAYLALVACPSGQIANEIQTIVDDETVYQVGSFISSHLANLRSSTDLYRQSAREHFMNVRPHKKFPSDIRKYSFNQEFSYAIGSLGLGTSADATVIYSQKDFLPRSSRFNLTGEIFGNSFNILQVAARQENMDLLMEHYFGPKGLFQTTSPDELYSLFTGTEKGAKHKRSIRDELNNFAKQIQGNTENEAFNDVHYDVSLKLFGTEMYFLSLGDQLNFEPEDFLKKVRECFDKVLTEAAGFNRKFETHSLFLDADLVYPTGVGFPLKLTAQGASVIRLEASGKINFKKIVNDPKNMKLNLRVVPSYNLDISGILSVDAHAVSTGIQVSGSVHSSTGAEIDFGILNDGHGVDVSIKLPHKKQEIFTFDHKIVFITQERGQETVTNNMKFSSKKKEFSGCFDQLSRYIGATFCADVSVTVPGTPGTALFPLNGGNKVSVWLEVDQAYTFRAMYDNAEQHHQSLELIFDTPGSEIPRLTNVKMEVVSQPKPFARIALDSPHRKASIETGYTNDDKEMALYANAFNDQDQYHGKVGFMKSGGGARTEYKPFVLYQTPNKKDDNLFGWSVTGTIIVEGSKPPVRYTFQNVQLIGPDPEPISVNGWVDVNGPLNLVADLALNKGTRKGHFGGSVALSQRKSNVDLSITSNFHEYANGKLKYDYERGEKNLLNNIIFVYGNDLESSTKRFELMQDYAFEIDDKKSLTALKFSNKLSLPVVLLTLRVDGEINHHLLKYTLEAGYHKYKVASSLDAKINVRNEGNYDVAFLAAINQHNVKVNAKRDIENDKSRLTNKLVASTGTRIELNGEVTNKPTATNCDIHLDGLLVVAEKQDPIKLNFVLLLTPEKANSNGKLLLAGNELLTYDARVTKDGENRNGQIDLSVKDFLTGKGTLKATGGNGEANLLFDVQKINRKLKIDSKFNFAAPVYELKNDFYYDYERDNTKKITVETTNRFSKNNIVSKNAIIIQSEKYEINAQMERQGQSPNDKYKSSVEVILPSNRQLSLNYEHDTTTKTGKLNGNGAIKFTDKLADQRARSLNINSRLVDADYKAKLFELFMKIDYTDFDGKNLVLDTNFKNVPNGQFKAAAAAVTVKGSMLTEVIDVLISVDDYCPQHANYRIIAKYGGQLNVNVNGKYEIETRGKPSLYDVSAQVNIPNTKIKSIKFQSNARYLAPQLDDGLYEGQFKVIASLDEKTISVDTTASGNGKHGSGNLNIKLPDVDGVSIESTYSFTGAEEDRSADVSFKCKYGNGKEVRFAGNLKRNGLTESVIQATLQTPLDNAKNIELFFKRSRPTGDSYNIENTIKVDDKTYGLTANLIISSDSPTIDIVLTYPEKSLKFYANVNKVGNHKVNGKMLVEGFNDFNGLVTFEMSYQSVDQFYLKVDMNAPKLNINDVHAEVTAKPAAGGGARGFEFKALSQNKNILSGYADYTIKEEKGKTVVEGQGNVKLYDKEKAASFKFVRNNFEEAKDGETGVHLVFTGLLGPRNVVLEVRLTNKVFHIRNTVCEEKNQCINFEIKSVLKQNPPKNYKHELIVAVDLRKFGYAYEFGLQSSTEREGFLLTHNFDIHLQAQDKTKYQYKAYIDSKRSGVQLTLPSRVIAIECVYQIPKELFGKYDVSVTSYLDKQNQPDNRATLGFLVNLNRSNKNVITSRGELKFSHPSIREMKIVGQSDFNGDAQTAVGRLELDIFKNPNQAILIVGKYGNSDTQLSLKGFNVSTELDITSRGLGFEYGFKGHAAVSLDNRQVSVASSVQSPTSDLKLGLYLFSSDQKLELIVTGFNEELVHVDGSFDTNKMNANMKSTVQFLGSVPIVAVLNVQGLTSFTTTITRDKLLKLNGEFSVGKEASLLLIGSGKELFRGKIALDQTHFLTSEYKVNDNEIKAFVKSAQSELKKDTEHARQELTKRVSNAQKSLDKQFDNIKNSIPDFGPIRDEYKQQWEKMIDELLADKTIKEFVDFFNRVYGSIGKSIIEIIKVLVDNAKKLIEIFTEFYKKLVDAFNDKILPAIKDAYSRIENIFPQIYEDVISLIGTIFERIVQSMKAFEDDFTKLGKSISEAFKSFAKIFSKYFEIIRKEVYDLYGFVTDNINELPGYDYLKKKFEEIFDGLIVPENIVNVLKEITNTLKDALPTKELDEFVQSLSSYIENKLTNKKVNDLEVIKDLYVRLVKAVKSVIDWVRSQSGDLPSTVSGFSPTSTGFAPIPFSLAALKRLPHLSSFRFSPWNYFRHEELPSPLQLFNTYRPYAFHPFNFLPPFAKRATIVDGERMITFDGSLVTIPGTCSYVLAQDFVDRNFSLVANLNGGKLKSISLMDKGDVVEVNANGIVNLNGKQAELPIHKADIHAWRGYYTVSILTEYGVIVQCNSNLEICHVTVNGYYHDKLRGLLGNGNSEPNDDMTLPNGNVAEFSSDFGNAYRVQRSCAALQRESTQSSNENLCWKVLGMDSPLRYCYFLIDPSNYRKICNDATAKSADKESTACLSALAYGSACAMEHIPVKIPSSCAKCDSKHEIGVEYQSVAPQKKADIVIAFDTSLGPLVNDLVQSMIIDLRKELRSRDITDTNIALIGYNNEEKYLSHYTTNGQLDFTGKLSAIRLDEAPKIKKPIKIGHEQFDKFIEEAWQSHRNAEKELGVAADGRAFREAMAYPFRSSASNVIIAIRPDQLEYSANPIKLFGAAFSNSLAQLSGITVHLVAPVKNLALTKDAKNTKNIVGFNEKTVVTLSDSKKRGNFGSTDMRNHLKFDSDMGVDLVLDGDGYVFNLNNFQQLKTPKEKKQFIATVATTLAEQISRTEVTSDCVCKLKYGLIPEESCVADEKKLLPPLKRMAPARG